MSDMLAATLAPTLDTTAMPPAVDANAGDNAMVSISTRFHLGESDMQDADLVLFAADNVFFYAHRSTLLRHSSNRFGGFVPESTDDAIEEIDVSEPMAGLDLGAPPALLVVPYSADVLNVVLHLVYGFPVQRYQPPAPVLRAVLPALQALGYDVHAFVAPHSELFMLFVQAAAVDPLPMYALAAQYAIESLAVTISTLTLSGSLSDITDELAQQMGPVYLKRLFFLHLGRTDALKRLLLPPPIPHTLAGTDCDVDTQKSLARAWALACAYVVVDGRPDTLASSLVPLGAHLQCSLCRRSMEERVTALVNGWNAIKCTI